MSKRTLSQRIWLVILASSGCLFQATAGCPTDEDIKKNLAGSTQTLVNNFLGLYTKTAVNTLFGL